MHTAIKALFAFAFLVNTSTAWIIVHCTYQQQTWGPLSNAYTCNARLEVHGEGSTVVNVLGTHQQGRVTSDVRVFNLNGQTSPYNSIPQNLTNFFPTLHGLNLVNGDIEHLTFRDLAGFQQLRYLNLAGNNLTYLEADLLIDHENLAWVSFNDNNIETIERGFLSGNTLLTSASFLRNPCVSLSATQRANVVALNRRLSDACPLDRNCPAPPPQPTTTTPFPDDCSVECSEKIDYLRSEFNNANTDTIKRVAELERIVREITASPSPFK